MNADERGYEYRKRTDGRWSKRKRIRAKQLFIPFQIRVFPRLSAAEMSVPDPFSSVFICGP
jgi:hypothetical protein